jgi:hypothetical protein
VRALTTVLAAVLLAGGVAGCAPGLSADADAWCKANPDAVFRASEQLKQGGTTNGWDPTKDEFKRACQKAWDGRAAPASPA